MKVCMLTGCDPSAVYMIRHLRDAGVLDRVIRIAWRTRPGSRARPSDAARPPLAARAWRRLEAQWRERQVNHLLRDMSRALFGADTPPAPEPDEEVTSYEVNGDAFAGRLRDLAPDIVLVNGGPILKPRIFTIPGMGTVNTHFGIAPAYRGVSTLFWPMYFGDHDRVGVTLHYINASIDGGAILGQGYPALGPGDTEATVMAKCARLAAEMFAAFVAARAQGPVAGRAQPGKGRLFLKKHRRPWHDLRYAARRRLGRADIPVRDQRIETFF